MHIHRTPQILLPTFISYERGKYKSKKEISLLKWSQWLPLGNKIRTSFLCYITFLFSKASTPLLKIKKMKYNKHDFQNTSDLWHIPQMGQM